MIKLYITRRPNGYYILTGLKPVITNVGLSDILDVFIKPGDVLASLASICPIAFKMMTGDEDLPFLVPTRYSFTASVIKKENEDGKPPFARIEEI